MRSWSWTTSSFNGAKPLITFCPKGLNCWAKPLTASPRSLQPPCAEAAPANTNIAAMSRATVTSKMMRFISATSFQVVRQPVAPLAPHVLPSTHLLRGVVLSLCPLLQIDTLPRLCFLVHMPDGIFLVLLGRC